MSRCENVLLNRISSCYVNRFCAHEYEKNKDMGAAALAYKCMEVAYLRITYSSHGNINRYRSELQAALQEIPSGILIKSYILKCFGLGKFIIILKIS